MNDISIKILREVAKTGELPLADALKFGAGRFGDHRDQYSLAMLVQDEYVGVTVSRKDPPDTELMREFNLAIFLHTFALPKDKDGVIVYSHPTVGSIKSIGNLSAVRERVFLKAKGALYLDDIVEKRKERWFVWAVAIVAAAVGSGLTALLGG